MFYLQIYLQFLFKLYFNFYLQISSIYKPFGDTVEEYIVTGGDDQSNVEDFFEKSEDEIKSTLDDA